MNKAIFLDRDGTIIIDKSYMHDVGDIELIDNVVKALRLFKQLGFLLVVITNQSGIGRGYYSLKEAEVFNGVLNDILEKKGCKIDSIYMCPHTPQDACQCRKPSPYMVNLAIKEMNIDPLKSYMFGDKDSDVECGIRAGVRSYKVTHEKDLFYWAVKIADNEI